MPPRRPGNRLVRAALLAGLLAMAAQGRAEYKPVQPGPVPDGCIALSAPGRCDQPGKTYVLTRDIVSPATALFLADGVTLDLNGHSISYAAGPYQHVPNCGFEDGLAGWDVSRAAGAAVESADTVRPFVGRKILRLRAGDEIVSPYVPLPVADRSYYAMCGVLDQRMKVVIGVDDADGRPVRCEFRFGSNVRPSCPQAGSPKLGGGFVFAHLHHLPAGKYRIRVRAETDCLLDEVDIRPAMDVGVAVIDRVYPWAYYKCILDGDAAAFFDFLKPGTTGDPLPALPRAAGAGTITIRNGTIRCGFDGVRSWAVQSTARQAMLVMENVKVQAAGINTNALYASRARIANCRFEIDTPFIIDRHRLADSPVALIEADGSEVAHCEFIGGQGNLCVMGNRDIRIHDNLFVNRQTVTNHYSLMLGRCQGARVFRNRFEPEIGSGLLMYGSGGNEVCENTFRIAAADGNCEYANADYSTNAIRITDYNAKPDPARPAVGNRIHHNHIHVTGRHYASYKGYVPIATALFVSVGACENHVHDNEITVDHQAPGTPAEATAFYIGGSDNGGRYERNTITTNVPAFWIATRYGAASNVKVFDNRIVKSPNAPADFQPFRLGWWRYAATHVEFRDNRFENCRFGVTATPAQHTYTAK